MSKHDPDLFDEQAVTPLARRIGKAFHNPISVVHHVGHRSGKHYKTSVFVARLDGRFVFAVPSGAEADWYRNIRSAGRCTLRWHGAMYTLEHPKPMTAEAARAEFPLPVRLILRIAGTRRFFTMLITGQPSSSG